MRQRAFTMAEAIVALALVVLVVNLFGLVMGGYGRLTKVDASEPTNWYLFISELESKDHQFQLVEVARNGVSVYSKTTNKTYRLSRQASGQYIYLSTEGRGGFLPIFEGQATKLTWEQVDQRRVRFTYTGDDMNKRRWYALRHRATSILLALLAMGCVTGILVTVSNYMTNQERITRQLIREQQEAARQNLRQANSQATSKGKASEGGTVN